MDDEKNGNIKEVVKIKLTKKEGWNVTNRINETSIVRKKGNGKFAEEIVTFQTSENSIVKEIEKRKPVEIKFNKE
jgi:hypothetical protein